MIKPVDHYAWRYQTIAMKEYPLYRPVFVGQIADAIGKKPFQVIADLMALNFFAGITHEVPDELVGKLGTQYEIKFVIVSAR